MAAAAGRRALIIINRVTVPGPRQVLLHVKIAEINRSATRDVGVSWLYARGQVDHRLGDRQQRRPSPTTSTSNISQALGPRGFAGPFQGT